VGFKIAQDQQQTLKAIESVQQLQQIIQQSQQEQSQSDNQSTAKQQSENGKQQSNNNPTTQSPVAPDDLLSWERTKLGIERTRLANQRTLLAYIRTSLAFFASAAALIEFFNKSTPLENTAYISIFIGLIILVFGFYSYYRSKKAMKSMEYIK
jgi:putative membrane protein